MPWDEGLTGTARDIAASDAPFVHVLAGPGTGKTYALIRRVARLIEMGTEPEHIMVCTFTRTAATDLRKELGALAPPGAARVRAGTLHSYCFQVLQRREVLQATGRAPRPLLKYEEAFLLEDIRQATAEGIRDGKRRLEAFNAAWARLQSEDPGWARDAQDQQFHDVLLGWLRFHEAMLLGEMVVETFKYLRDNPMCPERRAFDQVLVDEYQDLNRADQALLDQLAGNGVLAVIGDDNQSIYSTMRYAQPEGIVEFPATHPGTQPETLDECRRCPRLVVRLANHLIAAGGRREARQLRERATNPHGEVHVVQWSSMEEEARGIARFIRNRVSSDQVAAGDVIVLAPRRQFGYAVRDALNHLGTPAHSFFHEEALAGNPKTPDTYGAQEAFALLTLLAEPNDHVALRCWCGFGHPHLHAVEWHRLRDYCENSHDPPREVLRRIAAGEVTIERTNGLLARYQTLQERVAALAGLRGRGLMQALFPETEDWAAPVWELARLGTEADLSPADLKDRLRTAITQPELPTDVDYVRVMSLHKAKGLTANLVVVLGCIQGLIPSLDEDGTTQEQARALEEQRRLFYVAVTRTTQCLVLSSTTQLPSALAYRMRAKCTRLNADFVRTRASDFLHDLGPDRPAAIDGSQFLRLTGSLT